MAVASRASKALTKALPGSPVAPANPPALGRLECSGLLTCYRHANGHTEHMPELRWRFGYLWALALMVAVPSAIVLWARKKKWL